MAASISFTLNGQPRTITPDPRRSLLDVLREDFNLTGTKYGCGEGQCRACAVLINGRSAASCTTPISQVDRQAVLTIEGLAQGEILHPVQQAFLDERAFQCGYCAAGMIMGTVALLEEFPNPTDVQIRSGLQRHLCRCCNYARILKAVRRAAAARARTKRAKP
jgi:aerobic-type carbon monoxide dehydrogenase small subunit (CoxS/CutS family)